MNYELRIRNYELIILILVILGLILPIFSFARPSFWIKPEAHIITMSAKNLGGFAQNQGILLPPKDINEAKGIGEKALKVFQKDLPSILEKSFKTEDLLVWKKMWGWLDVNIWFKIWPKGKSEIEKRRAIIKEEFKKEKKELKTELPQVKKSLWERFKELIK